MILGGSGAAGSSGNGYIQKLPYNNTTSAKFEHKTSSKYKVLLLLSTPSSEQKMNTIP